jgi:hypothetical protein
MPYLQGATEMSKELKVRLAREHAKWVMDRCTIGNPYAMEVVQREPTVEEKKGMTSAIANAILGYGKGLKSAKGDTTNITTMGKLDNEGWLRIGDNFVIQMQEGKTVSLVCDTCAATMVAMLNRDVHFKFVMNTTVEMVRCGFNVHHFLAVDRAEGNINSFMSWGDNAFIIDIWDDKLHPSDDEDKKYGVFETPATCPLAIEYAGQLKVTQTFQF